MVTRQLKVVKYKKLKKVEICKNQQKRDIKKVKSNLNFLCKSED